MLYAFVVNDEVMYLGKSVRKFKQRLHGYLKPGPTQRTNQRVHAQLKGVLADNVRSVVEIYGFAPQEWHEYKGWRLDIAAGLEGELIRFLDPTWNVRNS